MNTFNTTLKSPEWAEESTLEDDGSAFMHKSANVSSETGISFHLERIDRLSDQNHFPVGLHSICIEAEGNGRYPSSNTIQIDLDEDSMGDPAVIARRIAAQLVVAADALDKAKGESK